MMAAWKPGAFVLLGLTCSTAGITAGITLERSGSEPEAASGGSTERDRLPTPQGVDHQEAAELHAREVSYNHKPSGVKEDFAKHGNSHSYGWVGTPHLQSLAEKHGRVRSEQAAAKQPLVELAAPNGQPGYGFENYPRGMILEGRMKNGSWVPVVLLDRSPNGGWRVHVADEYPGRFLDDVPYQAVRRPLQPGETDFLLDNSMLEHGANGLRYRHSKNVSDVSKNYAPWGTLVTGLDEGDGWVKTAAGYLPSLFRGADVLVKKERTGQVVKHIEEVPGMLHTSGPVFEIGEEGEFRSTRGKWYPCLITGDGYSHNSYNIIVLSSQYAWEQSAVVPVVNVEAQRLRRVTPQPPAANPHFPAPSCTSEGCQIIHVTSSSHRDFIMQLPVGSKFSVAMKMLCSRLKINWESCQKEHHYLYEGHPIHAETNVSLAGIRDTTPILMKDGPLAELQ